MADIQLDISGVSPSAQGLLREQTESALAGLNEPKRSYTPQAPVGTSGNRLMDAIMQRQYALNAPSYQAQDQARQFAQRGHDLQNAQNVMQNNLKQMQMNYAKEYATRKRMIQESQARQQAIGAILGFGGAIAGTILGSSAGPAGALAGGALGAQLGQSLGGATSSSGE